MSAAGEQIKITIEGQVVSLKKKLKETTERSAWRTEQPTIFRVLPNLRGIEPKAYEPTIVSLGPFHHHKSDLKAMDHLKWQYLNKFLGRNPEKPLEDYLKLIKENERQARLAYSEKVEMSSDDFVQMMLLDCCFLIETILSEGKGQATIWTLSPVLVRDMLILENQLPFCLLQPLFDSTLLRQSHDLNSLILGFLSKAISITTENPSVEESYHHPLHLFHSCILPANDRDGRESSTSLGHNLSCMQNVFPVSFWPSSWLHKLSCCSRDDQEETNRLLDWIPSATQLTEAGVHIRKKKEAKSFLDITFRDGKMEIPQLQVDDATNTLLRNLIAFEQCCKKASPLVTSYTALIDCIIDTAADVALLQQSKIINSGMGSGEEVATLFNRLCKEVMIDDLGSNYFSRIYKEVNEHYGARCNKWRARLNHDYFSNPWAIVSVAAAIFLFILTITQTVYAVLSYVQPTK
ncbi:hypothetical protein C4D60_Mb04t01690 [Musa balbisiana]|uniref:Uncharacterized protein n=1 Tax=Musa balbisiana TaxID=52838 RepID=A0A4S8K8X7_MUSBA|nr:hypothetical protein C4D60_Mb04t01690 [Musa balbisiana]